MNAKDFQNAADVLAREAKRFEGLAAAARALGEAGSMMGRIEEAEHQLADVRVKLVGAQELLVAAEADRMLAVEAKAELLKSAGEEANTVLNEGRARAAEDVEKARASADDIVAEARTRGVAMLAAAQKTVDAAQAQLAEKTDALRGLDNELAAREQELKAVENRIAAAREKIAAFAG